MRKIIVFDLDDTLYKEIEFLKSAFFEIASFVNFNSVPIYDLMLNWHQKQQDVFKLLEENFSFPIGNSVNIYRNHFPEILKTDLNLPDLLQELKNENNILGIITDGRSKSQRNKLKSLKIEHLFDEIIISEEFGSEKPSYNNYEYYNKYVEINKFYIGDNTAKDFITPNSLGWTTICLLDNGNNIHKQNFNLNPEYLPQIKIKNLKEIIKFINK
jgi:putative hydrolase of the HAD superfamily